MQVEVIDLCVLLQCVGFKMKSLDSTGGGTAAGQESAGAGRAVNIVCNRSGLHAVLESESTECSCPVNQDEHSSGFWQVSGVSNGVVQSNKETGSSLLGSLPHKAKAIIARELHKIIMFARNQANPDAAAKNEDKIIRCVLFNELSADLAVNRTSSMVDLNLTPSDERQTSGKLDTPTRYRSLDALTNLKNADAELPAPGRLVAKTPVASDTSDILEDQPLMPSAKLMGAYKRQQTYTRSTPDKKENIIMKSKTSSPIGKMSETLMQSLLSAEKSAEQLRNKLADLVKEAMKCDDIPDDCSVASLALDVSKISIQKEPPAKNKFVSSPNLIGLSKRRDTSTSKIKRLDSSSTSQLNGCQPSSNVKAPSRLKKLSPSFFRMKKDDSILKQNGDGIYKKNSEKPQSKFTSMLKPRISAGVVSPGGVRTPTNRPLSSENSLSLSTTKKKMYSHVKSTIPKPNFMFKKD